MRKILCIVVLVLTVINVAAANAAEAKKSADVSMKRFMQFDETSRLFYCSGYVMGASIAFTFKVPMSGKTFCAVLESKYGKTDIDLPAAQFLTLLHFIDLGLDKPAKNHHSK